MSKASVEGNTVVFYDREKDLPATRIPTDGSIIVSMKLGSVQLDIKNNRKILRNINNEVYQVEQW